MRWRWRAVGRLLGAAALVAALSAVLAYAMSGRVRYLVRAGVEEARILLNRRPIAEVVADPGTDESTRSKLALVLAARDFARDSLGLRAGETYTSYAAVRRDTLLLVLSASRYDRLAPYTWTWPVVGRVPYQGFFSFEEARREARRLEQRGMDTYLRPAQAFSTLGWFNDPLLSTIVAEDSADLAATVIHEILHNTLFVPGHVDFNESFANFVGYRGAEAFFRSRDDSANARRAAARWRDELRLARFWAGLTDQLEQLYAPGIAGPALREERSRVFALARGTMAGPLARQLETVDGRRLALRPLNNAVVLAQRVYRTHLERFERRLALAGGAVREAVAAIVAGARDAADPWIALGAESGPDVYPAEPRRSAPRRARPGAAAAAR